MKASHTIIKQIIDSMEAEEGSLFDKYAKRYGRDEELKKAYEKYIREGVTGELKQMLVKLLEKRSMPAGGTRLALKDRRRLRRESGKFEDY